MSEAALSGAEFKQQLRDGKPKLGLFVNSHSPTVAEQLAHSGYDWLLIDTQHGPMDHEKLSYMLAAVASGGAKSIVRVGRIRRPSGNPAGPRPRRRWRSHSLHQQCGGGTASRKLQQISHNRHAVGIFSAAQHEQGRLARIRRKRQQEPYRRAAGRNGFLHPKHGRDRRRPRCRYPVPRPERSVHVDGPLTKNTNSPTCTLRRSWERPRKSSSSRPARTKSFSDSSSSAPLASASSWKKDSPSSASATTCITS